MQGEVNALSCWKKEAYGQEEAKESWQKEKGFNSQAEEL